MAGVILQRVEILKPFQVAQGKLKGDNVIAFEKDFAMLLYTSRGKFLWELREGYSTMKEMLKLITDIRIDVAVMRS